MESTILAKLKRRQPDKTKGKILEKENKTDMERPTPGMNALNNDKNATGIKVSCLFAVVVIDMKLWRVEFRIASLLSYMFCKSSLMDYIMKWIMVF